jgi:hypothetical protein
MVIDDFLEVDPGPNNLRFSNQDSFQTVEGGIFFKPQFFSNFSDFLGDETNVRF